MRIKEHASRGLQASFLTSVTLEIRNVIANVPQLMTRCHPMLSAASYGEEGARNVA